MTHKLQLQTGICRQCRGDHSDAMKDIQLPIAKPTVSVVEADHTEETTVTEVLMRQRRCVMSHSRICIDIQVNLR